MRGNEGPSIHKVRLTEAVSSRENGVRVIIEVLPSIYSPLQLQNTNSDGKATSLDDSSTCSVGTFHLWSIEFIPISATRNFVF